VLAGEAPRAHPTIADWWQAHRTATRGLSPIERALLGGASADRVAWAFAAGYAAALRALVPGLEEDGLAALAATEEGGAHPRAIKTELRPAEGGAFALHGVKRFVTLATEAAILYVVAREAGTEVDGRPQLRVVKVGRNAEGVRAVPLPPTPFVPEIPHAEVHFEGVAVAAADVLPGDGYDRYLKPFRTIEDIHVHAAGLAFLVGMARRYGFADAAVARLVALLVALHALAAADPVAVATHVALEGVIRDSEAVLSSLDSEWGKAEPETRARWEADRGLFRVAGKVRVQRAAKAFERLKS
jgi:hypothetical protein